MLKINWVIRNTRCGCKLCGDALDIVVIFKLKNRGLNHGTFSEQWTKQTEYVLKLLYSMISIYFIVSCCFFQIRLSIFLVIIMGQIPQNACAVLSKMFAYYSITNKSNGKLV